jgi:MarR family 2-MHQ and catechol resistance regulon transcriptional repressor
MPQSPESSGLSLKLFVVLSKATRWFQERKLSDMQRYGLHATEFAVLELLYHKGEQPMQHIGEKILISSGSITYVVDKLAKKGLLQRKPSATDRRISYASITDEGRAWMESIFPTHESRIDAMFASLTDEEKQQLITLMKRLGYALAQSKGESL